LTWQRASLGSEPVAQAGEFLLFGQQRGARGEPRLRETIGCFAVLSSMIFLRDHCVVP
jgi:hypothetical protein